MPVELPRTPWSDPTPADVFPKARHTQVPNLTWPPTVFAAVRRGVTPAEMAYLERVAKAPVWKYFDIMARAPSMDYAGARFRMPFLKSATIWSMPIPRFAGTKELGYASATRAAYFLARGQRDSAENALRSTISVGFLMVDHGNTLIDQLIGVVIVGIGRASLVDYYTALGDPRGALLQARHDAVVAQIDAASANSATTDLAASKPASPVFENVDWRDATSLRAAIKRSALNAREMRGLRLEMLHLLGMSPCTNLRELVFGPEQDAAATFAAARASLGRFPSDSAIFDLLWRQPEGLTVETMGFSQNRAVERATRVVGAALNNKRLPGCVSMLSYLGS